MTGLFEPFPLGADVISNRVVMAPLTRRRAENEMLAPNELIAEYYRQRASAGLIVSEGSQISPQAYGYTHSPGCYLPAQIQAWKRVTEAVHQAGGKIFLQLWHVGPFSHPLLQPGGETPLSASPVEPAGEVLTPDGRLPYVKSRAMTLQEIRQTISDFGKAAKHALEAGFDGVEIHGAHAYLIDQFLLDGTNKRLDEYGGNIENRSRMLFEVIDEVARHIPIDRTGLRLSPNPFKEGMYDSDPKTHFGYIVDKLNDYKLAYLHISEKMDTEERLQQARKTIVPYYREIYQGTLISCGGHTLQSAKQMLEEGHADLIAFGKPFISNPDLVRRLRENLPLTSPDKDTFYHGGSKGYVDYPFYQG